MPLLVLGMDGGSPSLMSAWRVFPRLRSRPLVGGVLDRPGEVEDPGERRWSAPRPQLLPSGEPAYERYTDLYTQTAWRRRVDPNIGPRLPGLLASAGCPRVRVQVVQPAGLRPEGHEGDVKLVSPLTLENIADAALAENLASREEIDATVDELYRLADDATTLMAIPRIVQTWATARLTPRA
jgi:hypothetical protein